MGTLGLLQIPSSSFMLLLGGGPIDQPVILAMGFSNTLLGGTVPLPFDLSNLGATGCELLQSWDLGIPLRSNAAGQTLLTLLVPDDPTLDGGRLYWQWLCVDPPAKQLGLTVSQGLETILCY